MGMEIHVAKGAHGNNPGVGKCAAEWRYFLCNCTQCVKAKASGRLLTDSPPCSPGTLARVIPILNDQLTDDGRQRLADRIPLIPSIEFTADPEIVSRVEQRMALWCARSVEHLTSDERVRACNDVTERFLGGTAGRVAAAEAAAAARAAEASAWAVAAARGAAAAWAAEAASEAAAPAARVAAAGAAASAAASAAAWAAVTVEADDALLDWLDRMLDVWPKIAAEEGLLGSCGWISPDEFVQVNGS